MSLYPYVVHCTLITIRRTKGASLEMAKVFIGGRLYEFASKSHAAKGHVQALNNHNYLLTWLHGAVLSGYLIHTHVRLAAGSTGPEMNFIRTALYIYLYKYKYCSYGLWHFEQEDL